MASADRTHVPIARRLVPPACIALAALLHLSRLPVVEWLLAAPAIDLIAIYYWTLARPNRVPLWVLFLLGLVVDSFSTAMLGSHAILYLMGYGLARLIRHRMEAPTILPMWGVFAAWLGIILLAEWTLAGVQNEELPPISSLPLQWMISLFLYPIMHLLFDRLLTYGQRWRI
jgi:rod shape-determining protein MreD